MLHVGADQETDLQDEWPIKVFVKKEDEEDILFGWMDEADDFPENFIDGDEVEHFFPEKNLTFGGKV